ALWPMVGKEMLTRIITELYKPNDLKDVLITTCLFAPKIHRYVQENQRLFKKEGLQVGTYLPPPQDIDTERFLKRVNTAHSVLLGYKQKHGIQNMCDLAGIKQDVPSIEDLAKPETLAIYKRVAKGIASDADKDTLNRLQRLAGDAVANTFKPLGEEYPPFIITGCDALSTGDLNSMYEAFLKEKSKGALGLIKIKGYPSDAVDLVKNYGIILIQDIRNGRERDLVAINGFEEKSQRPRLQLIHGKSLFMVNPQLYCFDPAVLALVELFAKYGEMHGISPDWGRDILPVLAYSGNLLGDIMREDEYWTDVGEYGTFLHTAQDILNGRVPGISVPGSRQEIGWLNGAKFKKGTGDPVVEGPIYAGPGSIIHSTARIKESIIEREAVVKGLVHNSIIFEGAEIPKPAIIKNCIIGKGVKLPDVNIELEDFVVEQVYDKEGNNFEPILLATEIPYVREKTGEFKLDKQGRRLPINAAPGIPKRRFFPNF
ncbi:hypothetical protein AMJ44_05770, partial [candidate division WOR-1 bacterium DG_54_3]